MMRHAFVPTGMIPVDSSEIQEAVFRLGHGWVASICNTTKENEKYYYIFCRFEFLYRPTRVTVLQCYDAILAA